MKLYESRLSYFNDKATINHCKPLSVHQHGGLWRPRQNCHSCIFETKGNSNLRICIQSLGHHFKTTCQKSAKSMRYRVRPKFEFYRKSLLTISKKQLMPLPLNLIFYCCIPKIIITDKTACYSVFYLSYIYAISHTCPSYGKII